MKIGRIEWVESVECVYNCFQKPGLQLMEIYVQQRVQYGVVVVMAVVMTRSIRNNNDNNNIILLYGMRERERQHVVIDVVVVAIHWIEIELTL